MKHAREDYNRIQDPSGKIPEDEPVMLFRGQDKYFIDVLYFYAACVERDDPDSPIITKVKEHIELAKRWPVRKAPDLPG